MKRYMHIALIALFAQCGLSNVIYAMKIAPITMGDDAIVDVIKQYSNLTEADVNQYKLLWRDNFGTVGAFFAGVASTVGVEYMTHKLLYSRTREGILDKVQKFIGICNKIHSTSPADSTNTIYSIVSYSFKDLPTLQAYLPEGWKAASDLEIYNALCNLADQAKRAQILLNQIGEKSSVGNYITVLSDNAKLYSRIIPQKKHNRSYSYLVDIKEIQKNLKEQKESKKIQKSATEEHTGLAKAGKYAIYASMLKGGVSNVWNGIKELYAHPEILALFGAGWVTTRYLMPSIIQSKIDILRGFFSWQK